MPNLHVNGHSELSVPTFKKGGKTKQTKTTKKKKRKKEKKQDFSQGRNTFNIVRDFLIEMSQISV